MEQHLTKDKLKAITQASDISELTVEQIKTLFLDETAIHDFAPDGICQIDPRNGDRIVYNSARARRPHDNHPIKSDGAIVVSGKECVICQGKTTHVVDIAQLSEGFTFINKNLFPILYPSQHDAKVNQNNQSQAMPETAEDVHGFHFLQWTSSYHEKDWQNMPPGDRLIVLQRLAALEQKMMTGDDVYVSIIKNYGHLVGGSLVHGHQQIAVSKIMPNRFRQDRDFQKKHGESFSAYLLRENPSELTIRDYGPAVLLTPHFMRRPYDMMVLLKDPKKSNLHSLSEDELVAVGEGWRDAIWIMLNIMPRIGKEVAYNVTTHNVHGGTLYFEFLPYTQEMGGFEHLGLYLCQGNPKECAQISRKLLEEQPAL
jgi:galactose-1-phosphate uridylyltransferase